jgi:hypothetical protein
MTQEADTRRVTDLIALPVDQLLPADTFSAEYLQRCVDLLEGLMEPPGHALVSLQQQVSAHFSPQQLAEVNRGLASNLARVHGKRIEHANLPIEIRSGFHDELARIQAEIERKPAAHFSFANYRFKADMRILCVRRFPAGMYDLEVSGIPRSLLLRQGIGGAVRLSRVILRAGGFWPFFTQHIAPHRIKLFSPDERERFLSRAASLLQKRDDIRGLISTAWYNDPAIARVGPQLAYLREGWQRWGCGVFRIGASPEVTQEAIAYSFERRRLVDAGKYLPTAYLGIALREQLLRFAPGVGSQHEP